LLSSDAESQWLSSVHVVSPIEVPAPALYFLNILLCLRSALPPELNKVSSRTLSPSRSPL
jgi:hypothetical protein